MNDLALEVGGLELATDGSIGDVRSAEAQERYEAEIVEQARQIAAGRSMALPTREHLRVVLSWLDGVGPQSRERQAAPF